MPTVSAVRVKSILSAAHGYIGSYDYTLTPYLGCAFGCTYCFVPTLVYRRKLARLVDPHATWVVAQALKTQGPGARTWEPARHIVKERGWEDWLQGRPAVRQAMDHLRTYFGDRFHEGSEGFGLGWLD